MKILHLCLEDPYIEGWGYQQNILSEYHKKMGHEVSVIASKWYPKYLKYEKEDFQDIKYYKGIKIVRVGIKFNILNKLKLYDKLYKKIDDEKPDLIFFHTIQSLSLLVVRKYIKKNKKARLVVDVHSEFNIAARSFLSKHILHSIIWRSIIAYSIKYIDKVFCTKPWSVEFVKHFYKIKENKIHMLLLGVDMDYIHLDRKDSISRRVRKKYNIDEHEFLIITGGKLEPNKKILEVVKAFNKLNEDYKLLVVGSPPEHNKKYIEEIKEISSSNVIFTGWIESNNIYDLFLSADLGVFPGIHSVLWEQAVCCGLPLIIKKWPFMTHVDVGGNIIFLYTDELSELEQTLKISVSNFELLDLMSSIAIEKGIEKFSYKNIAKKSIE